MEKNLLIKIINYTIVSNYLQLKEWMKIYTALIFCDLVFYYHEIEEENN